MSTSVTQTSSPEMTVFRYADLSVELRHNIIHALLDDRNIVISPDGKHAVAPTELRLVSKAFTHDLDEALRSWKHPQDTVYEFRSPVYWGESLLYETLRDVAALYNPNRPHGEPSINVIEFACFNLSGLLDLPNEEEFEGEDYDIPRMIQIHQILQAYRSRGTASHRLRIFCDIFDIDDQPKLINIAMDVIGLWRDLWEDFCSWLGKVIPIVRLDCTYPFHQLLCEAESCYLDPHWRYSIDSFLDPLAKGTLQRVEFVGLTEEARQVCDEVIGEDQGYKERLFIRIEDGLLVVQARSEDEDKVDDEENLDEET